MGDLQRRPSSTKDQPLYLESIGLASSQSNERMQPTRHDSIDPLRDAGDEITGVGPEEKLTLGQAIKRYPTVVAYCIALTIVVLGWGYDLVIVGSIVGVESFQIDYGGTFEGRLIIPAQWLAAWQAATPLGMAFGSLFGGWVQDRIGRKLSLTIGSVISGVGVTIIFLSFLPPGQESMRAMFFAGKLVQGFGIGILKVTAMTYMSENSPTAMRGSAMGLFPVANLIGQLIGSIVVFVVNDVKGNTGYLAAFGSQWPLALAPFILSFIMPESPAYLLARGKDDQAAAMAHRLFAPKADSAKALEEMRVSIRREQDMVANVTYVSCFNSVHLRRTWIVVMANLYPALFGLDLLARSSYFLQTLGMDSRPSLMILIGGIVAGIAANAAGIWILSRVGRRKVILVSLTISIFLWAAIGIAGIWGGLVVAYFTAGAATGIIVVCGMGVWPAAYAVMGETSSLTTRAKTQALGGIAQQASSVVMGVVLPFVYNPDAGNLGAKVGFVFVGLCSLAVAMTWFQLPEMRGRSIRDINQMFSLKLATREFSHWKRDDESG